MKGHTDENKHYVIGDLLWAKIGKYPFWPCMVSYDPYKGRYSKWTKVRNGEERIYHVQYFGKQVQHGWTKAGKILPFEGEEKFNSMVENLMEAATGGAKKAVKLMYGVPATIKKLWHIAVKEANYALAVDPLERFESFVFKYETKKKSTLNENYASPKRSIDIEEDNNGSPPKKAKSSSARLKDGIMCKLCEEVDADVTCAGDCFQSFHKECLGLLCIPRGFKCICCELGLHFCIICKKAEVSLTKCIKCQNHYHEECIKTYQCADIVKKVCPAHTCLTCYNENPKNVSSKGAFLRCFRCPNIFHKDDCKPIGTESLTTSYIICPDHYLGKKKVSPQPSVNVSYCSICSEGGELICCESCPSSYHSSCIDQEVPSGDFFCEDCAKRRYLYEGMIVWAKTGAYRWWPALIVPEAEIPANILNIPQYEGEFSVRYYGTGEYFWTHRGRVIPYVEHHKELKLSFYKQNALSVQFKLSLQEAARAYDNYLQNHLNEKKFSSKRNAYKHIRVNRAVPPAQIVIWDVKSISPCSCNPNMPNPCGIDSMCLNRSMLMECHPDVCKAKELCENQKFQKRQYASCRLKKTEGCGWGLESQEFIKKGSFVIEYVGEIITHEEYRRRVVSMRENNIQDYYFLYLDSRRMIDAGPKGNLARFINHSCSPNCEMVKWSVNGDSRIGIFALTDIQPGQELTFHYQSDSIQFQQKCLCGAQNCEGFIGRNGVKNGKKNHEALNGRNGVKNGKKDHEAFNGRSGVKNGKKDHEAFNGRSGVKSEKRCLKVLIKKI